MSTFLMTPTNYDLLESLFRDPITGKWMIPYLTFDTRIINPYFGEMDPLNDDPRYHERVIENIYTRLSEKWLFKDPIYRSLLKYFQVEKSGDKGTVSLISDPEKTTDPSKLGPDDSKYIFKYIEKYFITRRFVSKILKEYASTTRIKWYDLFNNIDTLKDLFCHKLKKLIISTIYEIQKKE